MDALTAFGVAALSFMMLMYALEARGRTFILAFAAGCALSSAYGFLSGAWPFGVVEAVWTFVALVDGRRPRALMSDSPGAPTVVIGTAGHIDHGKTSLLRALTGIDADRLPEERARGMTIDVGYAHLGFDDGVELDFVDVPGHDRLIGNMLVGAGEIDAVMLVVAADDGPRPQTLEHLQLLDALGVWAGLAVVTKIDMVDRPESPRSSARSVRCSPGRVSPACPWSPHRP